MRVQARAPRKYTPHQLAEKKRERCRDWYSKNKDYRRMYLKEWKRLNPGAVAGYQVSRRKRLLEFIKQDKAEINALYAKAKSEELIACYICGDVTGQGGRHVDHIVSLANGGDHVSSNLAIACTFCNLSKHSK